jgi:hypothetical protein
MRDVFIDELDLDDEGIERIISQHMTGSNVTCERTAKGGDLIVDINADGLEQRLTFCVV